MPPQSGGVRALCAGGDAGRRARPFQWVYGRHWGTGGRELLVSLASSSEAMVCDSPPPADSSIMTT